MKKSKLSIIGCDNGCTGTLSVFSDGVLVDFIEQFSYKWRKPHVKLKNSYMSRIDHERLIKWLLKYKNSSEDIYAVLERPMTDESRFQQTISSHHAQEAVMISMEIAGIKFMTVNSFEWQKIYLPNISGSVVLKEKCAEKAINEFPKYKKLILKHGDADAIYIGKLVVDFPDRLILDENRPMAKSKLKKKKIFLTNFKTEENVDER